MSPKKVSDQLSVSPQLSLADIDDAAARGFRMIVNNRPDGEEAGQPLSADLAARAKAAGLAYRHIPVVGGSIGDSDVAAFARALDESPGPVLGFCRTGTRSTTLWALSCAGAQSSDTILKAAAGAGYDLGALPLPAFDRADRFADPAPVGRRLRTKIS